MDNNGFAAIRTANGVYFERHRVKVKVTDRAGNATESEEIDVYVRREQEDE